MDDIFDGVITKQGEHPISYISSIGSTLSPALKAKILEDKYINFANLLQDQEENFTLSFNHERQLSLTPSNTNKITTFDQWLKCFLIFASISR